MAARELTPKPPEKAPINSASRPEASVTVVDAWEKGFELARGLDDLIFIGSASDEGLSEHGFLALWSASRELVDQLKIVDGFFNPRPNTAE